MSVRRAQEEIDCYEFQEWMEYRRIAPFGYERTDLGFAIVASVMANAHAAKGHRFKPKDFMPRFDVDSEEAKEEKAKEVALKLAAFIGMHNRSLGA